jgi:protoporphyrinogen oxidase
MTRNTQPVIILGAGLAGLTAAAYLHRHGIPVRVFEGGANIAGLCRSEKDEAGFTYDCGAHFLTNRLAAAVGMSADCRPMPRYGETVYYQKRLYSYPFGLLRSPQFLLSALISKCGALFRRPAQTATEHYRNQYGRALADRIAMPLTAAWSGASGDDLAASVGEKFSTSLPWMIALRLAARLTRRTVAIGYSSTVVESPSTWHVYPEGGIAMLCEQLASEVREHIHTNSKVESILVEHEGVTGVRVNGEIIPSQTVISTAPVHILPKLMQGTDRLAYLSLFEYRSMVFINLKIDGPSKLPDVVTWTPEADFPFFRVSDIGLGLPWLVPENKTLVTCDIGCQLGDEVWQASEEELTDRCMAGLEKIVPGIRSRIIGSRVVRVPLAYPVFRKGYESDRRRFEHDSGINGLISVGRNGEFAHILMEDVYWRTRWKLSKFLREQCIAEQN